ncbi:tripartite tricarboxylate transporter TctB family protein [Dietzia sp. PP-33]|uniref:tripartite tricarboxylate transporter TctB family protein n=1 Tax=Dietzia sp. PP-33 TaxID=2957500 RepID=UPI0029ABEEB0|nr:tripartite tricarboxylate transporter TctB family protein [Dietzia sp. PP-33]MDX2358215.1 tripartite tricarboxylate transporter TctB family protein [Dietzia sp. PP-33]
MSTSTDPASTAVPHAQPGSRTRWWRNRTELGFATGILAIAAFMTVQIVQMDVPDGAGTPGPQFFPGLVAGFLLLTGVLLAINVIRNPRHTEATSTMGQLSTDMLEDLAAIDHTGETRGVGGTTRPGDPAHPQETDSPTGTPSPSAAVGSGYIPVDYRTTGIVLCGLVAFALTLQPVGWLVTASALFWVVSYALGSRRPLFDVAVSVIFASVIQIAFSAGLGLGLPPGILEGVLPWSN